MMRPPDAAQDLGYQTNRLARLLRSAVAHEIAPLGLTARQAAVVLQLAEAGPLPMSDVAERIGVDRPTLTGVVNRLERDDWLATMPNPDDGRSRLVKLTPRAHDAVPMLVAASGRAASGVAGGLSREELSQLVMLLARAADALEPSSANGGKMP